MQRLFGLQGWLKINGWYLYYITYYTKRTLEMIKRLWSNDLTLYVEENNNQCATCQSDVNQYVIGRLNLEIWPSRRPQCWDLKHVKQLCRKAGLIVAYPIRIVRHGYKAVPIWWIRSLNKLWNWHILQWLSCLLIAVADVKAKQMIDILMGMDDLSKYIKKITKEGKYTKLLPKHGCSFQD